MNGSWVQRLEAARRRSFVGRQQEIQFLREVLQADPLPILVLYYYGPGGIGKTSLLRELAHIAAEEGAAAIYLDARNLDPSPDGFTLALQQAEAGEERRAAVDPLGRTTGRRLLIVDTYERLRPLDGWLRETWLPQLTGNELVVLAGRHAPEPGWRSDPGWQSLMRTVQLQNLAADDARTYLNRRAIPATDHETVLSFTRGHPLALSLIADTVAQQPRARFVPGEATDIIKMLVERLVEQAPGPRYRAGLEASARLRLTNESILAALLGADDAHDVFDWLRELSFMSAEPGGIFPHDLARDALALDLRWRNPDWFAELHARARRYYVEQLPRLDPQGQRRLLSDYVFLHRENPVVKPFLEWQTAGQVFTDRAHPDDVPGLVAMVRRHEGEGSGRIADYWLTGDRAEVTVLRGTGHAPAGLLVQIRLERTTPAERELDPAVDAAWRYLQLQTPLRAGETATLFRFWMAADTYQAVSPVQTRIFLNMVQHYLTTPGLALTCLPCADPDFWSAAFAYGDLRREPALDYAVGSQHFGVYMRDWRASPPLTWLELMGKRELASGADSAAAVVAPAAILDEATFAAGVRDALRHMNDPLALQRNVLLATPLVRGEDPTEEATATLVRKLREAIDTLQHTPRQRKQHRALFHTYVQPAPTQEKAAELLDIPFSTYRRHLAQGIKYVTAWLQQQA